MAANSNGSSTRQNILNAASRLFSDKGFDRTGLKEIAQAAGYREPTIYLHFKGKEDVLFSVAEQHMAKYLDFLDEHLQGIVGAYNKLRKFIWAQLRYSSIDPEYLKLVLFECRCNRKFYKSGAYKLFRKCAGILSSILTEGIEEKIFRDDISIPIVRDIIFGMLDYESVRHFIPHETHDTIADQEEIMHLLERMIMCKYRVEVDPADKRRRILQAAVQIFAHHGYAKATVAEIARTAQVAEGTVYEYFKNKEDLLLSISEDRFNDHMHRLNQTFSNNDPRQKLRLFLQNHFQQYLNDPDFLMIFLTLIQFNPRFYRSRAYKTHYKYVLELEDLIRKIVESGAVSQDFNIRIFRNMFLGAFTHMTLRWFVVNHGRKYDKMREIEKATDLLSNAMSAQEAAESNDPV
ncbi:MAG: TetR/AcrR family transcriptional regulator [Proteobacteria bacterium]|nr:TetR/AcrR family transcriptional regulator [Pseudomonadota bacterium]